MEQKNRISTVMYLYAYSTIYPQFKEAIECYQLAAVWAACLDVEIETVREGARMISEFEGIPFREALERYGKLMERTRMKEQLAGLPLIGPFIMKMPLSIMTRRQKKEIRERIRRITHGRQ